MAVYSFKQMNGFRAGYVCCAAYTVNLFRSQNNFCHGKVCKADLAAFPLHRGKNFIPWLTGYLVKITKEGADDEKQN